VIAPNRSRRPGAATAPIPGPDEDELAACPFCEGREERTPPEVLALGRETGSDGPGWHVRVVPNLYPAFARQEVVVHGPAHVRSFADLDDGTVSAVAEAWSLRRRAGEEDGLGYLHALVNEGVAAGASLPHSHSQLVWLDEPPPAVRAEHPGAVEELLRLDRLAVGSRGPCVAVVHPAGRAPYETLVGVPDGALAEGLLLLRDLVRRLRAVEGPVAWNAWLHPGHLELVPRLAVFAGIELGAAIWVNTLAPEDAAAALRGVGVGPG
jgi:UDPglucose--hexose-1-phosphate uridylyltransferase